MKRAVGLIAVSPFRRKHVFPTQAAFVLASLGQEMAGMAPEKEETVAAMRAFLAQNVFFCYTATAHHQTNLLE